MRLDRHGAWLPFVPLVIAAAALGAREATRTVETPPVVQGGAREFVVPPAILAAVQPPQEDCAYTVELRRSRAVWQPKEGRTATSSRVSGGLVVRPDGSLAQLQLTANFSGAGVVEPGLDVTFQQSGPAVCHHSAVPNTCTGRIALRARVDGAARDLMLDASWMRVPGGTLRLQGTVALDGGSARSGSEPATVALDFVLVPER